MAQRKLDRPARDFRLEEAVALRAKIEAGTADASEAELAQRALAHFRQRWQAGILSKRAAAKLGLADA